MMERKELVRARRIPMTTAPKSSSPEARVASGASEPEKIMALRETSMTTMRTPMTQPRASAGTTFCDNRSSVSSVSSDFMLISSKKHMS
jgi:hypothetical protein